MFFLKNKLRLLSLERENVTLTDLFTKKFCSYKEETQHDRRRQNLLWGQHYLRTFVDLDLHLFEQIIRVCWYIYDGFSSRQWKIKKRRSHALKQCNLSAFCSGFVTLGSFLATSNNYFYNLMPKVAYETRLITTLGRWSFTCSGKFFN